MKRHGNLRATWDRGPLARIPGAPRLAARLRASGPRSQGFGPPTCCAECDGGSANWARKRRSGFATLTTWPEIPDAKLEDVTT